MACDELRKSMSNMKWKSHLLSSGLPLEYQAAKILAAKGFNIEANYSYARNDNGVVKDFSIDLRAVSYVGLRKFTVLNLLVECKHRLPQVKWLFLPEPNPKSSYPTFRSGGDAVHIVHEFSDYSMDTALATKFERSAPLCYKGIEIVGDSGAHDAELKHGIAQLQYALPRFMAGQITSNVLFGYPNNRPFAYCPILLTTAELFVARKDMSVKKVEQASNIDDLGTNVSYLILRSGYGPDFESHCQKEAASLVEPKVLSRLQALDPARPSNDALLVQDSSVIARIMSQAGSYPLTNYFTKFLVCTYTQFPNLIDTIKKIVSRSTRTQRQIPLTNTST